MPTPHSSPHGRPLPRTVARTAPAPTTPAFLLTTALLMLLVTALLTGTLATAAPAHASNSPRADQTARAGNALTGAPRVGTCTRITWMQAAKSANRIRPVSCRTRHTSQVVAVAVVPKGESLVSTSDAVAVAIAHKCVPALSRATGQPITVWKRSVYGLVWFVPTAAQQKHGARWVRCDIAAYAGQGFSPLPKRHPLISGTLTNTDLACLLDTHGRGVYTTSCSRPHTLQPVGWFTIHTSRYPTPDGRRRIANQHCDDYGSSYYGWRAPTFSEWLAGYHRMICYV